MSKVCTICGKGPSFGNNVSHSQRKTRRRWDANLQKLKIVVNESPQRAYVCSRCIKAGKVVRAL